MPSIPFSIDVHTGPDTPGGHNDFEAAFARRAMILVRGLLGDQGLTELLRGEISASNEYWRETSSASNGKWRASRIVISPRGLTSKEFINWFLPKGGEERPGPDKVAVHPEHWVICPSKDSSGMSVLETLGDKVSQFSLDFDVTGADFVSDDPTYPTKMTGRGYIEGGIQIVELYHQFKDHEDGGGFNADLAIYFPAACGNELIETHRQHLLVEFSNWLEQAYKALKLT